MIARSRPKRRLFRSAGMISVVRIDASLKGSASQRELKIPATLGRRTQIAIQLPGGPPLLRASSTSSR